MNMAPDLPRSGYFHIWPSPTHSTLCAAWKSPSSARAWYDSREHSFPAHHPADSDHSPVQTYTSVILALAPATTVVFARKSLDNPVCCQSLMSDLAFAGWLSDHCRSRRPLFISAMIVQAVAIGLFMDGKSLTLWLIGVVLVGLSSSVVWSSSLAMILDRVPKAHIAQSLGYTSLSLGLGIFLGPILGGVLFEHGGPYAPWGLCFGIVAIDVTLRLLIIDQPPRSADQVECDVEDQASLQFLPALRLMSSPRLLWALLAAMAQAAVVSSFDASLPIFARDTFGWNASAAGLLYIPFVIPSFFGPLIGDYTDRRGGRVLASSGFLLGTVVLVCLRFVEQNSISQKVLLCVLLFLSGLFVDTTVPVFSSEVAHVVFEYEEKHPGVFRGNSAIAQAEGVWWAGYSIGLTFGPLWGGFVQEAAGWKTLTWTLGLLSGVTAIPVFLYTGGFILKAKHAAVR